MGNCFSDVPGGRAAIGGTARGLLNAIDAPNDAVDNFLRSRGYHGLFSQIELSFSASGLRDRDVLSKIDPMMVLYTRGKHGALEEIGHTEVVLNSLDPKWITKHLIMFRVYDIDTQFHNLDVKMLKLEEQQFLELHREDPIRSMHSQNCRKLLVHAEECVGSKTTVEMIFRCSDLENRDLFSKSDPFLIISKLVEGGTHIPICKTEVIKNDLSPQWKPVFLNIQQVGGKDNPLILECYNFNTNGKHDLIGKVQESLALLEKLHASGQGGTLFLPTGGGHNSHNKVLKSRVYLDKFSETSLLQMGIHAFQILCIISILQDGQMHTRRQLLRLERCYSFMIQTNDFLHGDLVPDQLMVLFPIVLTSMEAVTIVRWKGSKEL
ncbi:hypothetical protein Ahy_B03g063870 isoform M [Arachis hypogaea]|uniref:C2 domain-containing protein n=1 Tax=Arachis hypogaea TaxID=3818 RepID=A0A444ZYA7_ARAHY|nr:hypothetical protein Ahy_B03g063870 isoform M [Arachis hypogaea]